MSYSCVTFELTLWLLRDVMIGNIVYNRFMAWTGWDLWTNMNICVYLKHADDVFFARYIISVFVVGIVEDNNEQGECWDSYNYYGEEITYP